MPSPASTASPNSPARPRDSGTTSTCLSSRPSRMSCTLADVANEPIEANSRLGIYTNFVNLLDLAAIAVPGPFRERRPPRRRHPDRSGGARCPARRARRAVPSRRRRALRRHVSPITGASCAPGGGSRRHDRDRRRRRASLGHVAERRADRRRAASSSAPSRRRPPIGSSPLPGGPAGPARASSASPMVARRSPPKSGLCRRTGSATSSPASHRRSSIGTLKLADGTSVKGFLCEPVATSDGAATSAHSAAGAPMSLRSADPGVVDEADMRGGDPPAVGGPHPALHLPPDLARRARPAEERRGDGEVAPDRW